MTRIISALLAAAVLAIPAAPAAAAEVIPRRKPDLADVAHGTYNGAVVADTRGGSRSDVTITVKRVGKNLVEISSDYDRIPTVQIALSRAMDAILAAKPGNGFLIEQGKDARRLDLSIDGVTLIVRKQ